MEQLITKTLAALWEKFCAHAVVSIATLSNQIFQESWFGREDILGLN